MVLAVGNARRDPFQLITQANALMSVRICHQLNPISISLENPPIFRYRCCGTIKRCGEDFGTVGTSLGVASRQRAPDQSKDI
jgi:hypothetical protein